MPTLLQKLKSLPQSPGVYIFKSKTGEVLYVGKAASLKDRVNSYFQNKKAAVRAIEMYIDEVKDLAIKKTDTVLEAYILEQHLIKKIQPKYNSMGKDDRSFCYVVVTKEDYPRFVVLRKTELDQISNSQLLISNKISNPKPASPAGRLQIPNKLQNLKSKLESKLTASAYKLSASKIYGPYTSRGQIEEVLKILRKIFPYHNKPEHTEKGCFDYHIGLCPGPYDDAISKSDYRKNIRAIGMILEGKKRGLVSKMKKEMNKCSDAEDYECAAKLRNQMFALQHVQDVALISKRDENFQFPISNFQINSNDQIPKFQKIRIEGYDISNISGKHSVGSMVVFDNSDGELKSNPDQYRKFRIKTIEGANDVGMMEEVLMRRFRNNWKLPDLIILDGGRGHLNMARRVLRIYHLDIPLLAVAKGPTRKKLDQYSWGTVPKIPKNIIEQLRDEAHRFAISYHRKLRGDAIRNN